MLSAILFDLDGTLVNTNGLHFETWKEALSSLGINIDRAFYNHNMSGRTNEEIVKDILPQLSLEECLKIVTRQRRTFSQFSR